MPHCALTPAIALAACCALAARGPAQSAPQHALALINDARSHGQVGDGWLSLNEAIQLTSGTLLVTQLSLAEQLQIQSFGDVAFAELQVPLITLERDLDPILDTPTQHGFRLHGGNGSRPTIDFGNHAGLVTNGTFTSFVNLELKGGDCGITIVQDDTVYGASVESCSFLGQRGCGVRVLLPTDGKSTRIELTGNTYTNLPQAVSIEDLGTARTGQVHLFQESVQGCTIGHGVLLAGAQGRLDFAIDRLTCSGTPLALLFLRAHPGASRKVTVDARFVSVAGALEALHYEGSSGSVSVVGLSQCDLQGSGHALVLRSGVGVVADVRDSRLGGPVAVQLAGLSSQVDFRNVRADGGAWRLDSSGAGIRIGESLLSGIHLASTGSAPVVVDGACFVGGSALGTATAPIQIDGSYLGTLRLGANVTTNQPLARAQLGSGDIAPRAPVIGAPLELRADLPPALVGFWLLGAASTLPPLELPGFRVYFDLGAPLLLAGAGVRLQQRVTVQIPNDPALLALPDWFAQLAVVPDPGLVAPPLNLAPGRRFPLR